MTRCSADSLTLYREMINKFLLILFVFGNILYSQQGEISHDYILKFSILDLLTGIRYESSTLQFGLEKGLAEDLSINSELGYSLHINREPGIFSIDLDNSSGFAFETEIRKYMGREKTSYIGSYLSIDFLYRYLDAKNHHSGFLVTGEEFYSFIENYSIYRNECAIHLKYGYQNISTAGFVSDFSIGIGWRYITSRTISSYPVSFIQYEFPYNKPFNEGSRSFFSVTAAIRIGWSLK